jgi:hypothetical protein
MRKFSIFSSAILAILIGGSFASPSASAREIGIGFHEHGPGFFHRPVYAHPFVNHWYRGYHESRFGWWWISPVGWRFYTQPVYVQPVTYVTPPTVVVNQPAPPQAPPQNWYYCNDPQGAGYSPSVGTCTTPWVVVPANPQQ